MHLEYAPSRAVHTITPVLVSDEGLSEKSYDTVSSSVEIHQTTRYGAGRYLEVGETFKALIEEGRRARYRLGVNFTGSNMPLRTYGPSEAGDQEYFNGPAFSAGQYLVSLNWHLPFLYNKADYRFMPIYDRVRPAGAACVASTALSFAARSLWTFCNPDHIV
jgi:hypothetical protein